MDYVTSPQETRARALATIIIDKKVPLGKVWKTPILRENFNNLRYAYPLGTEFSDYMKKFLIGTPIIYKANKNE